MRLCYTIIQMRTATPAKHLALHSLALINYFCGFGKQLWQECQSHCGCSQIPSPARTTHLVALLMIDPMMEKHRWQNQGSKESVKVWRMWWPLMDYTGARTKRMPACGGALQLPGA